MTPPPDAQGALNCPDESISKPSEPGVHGKDFLDVVVIGAGQAGLAVSWHLAQQRLRYVVVDASTAIGHSWRSRWDSLRLFSPAQYDALPGMAFPAAADTYPTKDQVADYLVAYAERFQLPVLLGHRVTRLTRDIADDGAFFTVHTSQGPLRARQVVVATGAFQKPKLPAFARLVSDRVTQLHSAQYRNSAQLPAGEVLVVGAGNSGLQIAEELVARRGAGMVHLAIGGRPATHLPQRFAGRDLFWWLTRTGAINRPARSLIARRLRARGDLVIGTSPARVADLGVSIAPRVIDADRDGLRLEGGAVLQPSAVVWATGFAPDYAWIDVANVLTDKPHPHTVVHERGVSDVPGLYFIGLRWQHTRGSALLGFVHADAAWLTDRMSADRR